MSTTKTIYSKQIRIKKSDNINAIIYGRKVFKSSVLAALVVFVSTLILFFIAGVRDLLPLFTFAAQFAAIIFVVIVGTLVAHVSAKPENLIVAWGFTDHGARLSDKAGNVIDMPWDKISHIHFLKKGILLEGQQKGYRWIPRRAFSTFQTEGLKELTQEKLIS